MPSEKENQDTGFDAWNNNFTKFAAIVGAVLTICFGLYEIMPSKEWAAEKFLNFEARISSVEKILPLKADSDEQVKLHRQMAEDETANRVRMREYIDHENVTTRDALKVANEEVRADIKELRGLLIETLRHVPKGRADVGKTTALVSF